MGALIVIALALTGIALALAEQRSDKILIQGNTVGNQTVQTDATRTAHAEYSYNDRGRGDHIIAIWKLDAAGVPTEYKGHGNDYMKAPIEERFEVKDGKARWKNRSEHGEHAVTGEAFYVPANAPPEFTGVLARALLKAPSHKLSLLPAGEASIEESGKLSVEDARRLLAASSPEMLPYWAIGLFVGLRPSEIRNLQWKDVDFEDALITVRSTKTGRKRFVKMQPNLTAWLTPHRRHDG